MTVNLIRAAIIYVFVIVAVRLMGKRTVGELNPHELVITILLSAIAVIPLEENSMPLANCLVPILLFVSLEIIVACVSLKSVKIRNFVQGRPIMIIKDGKLHQSKLAQLRFTIDDVVDKLADYEDLEEQGRLIKIPLEAYCIVDFKVRKGFVLEETYHMGRKPLLVVRYDDNSLKSHRGYLGISVFLTKSEAEAKLKELRGGENESSN